jgi:potassium channel subfamily K, other eukaryote
MISRVVAINTISFIIAIIANAFLLLVMAQRLSFSVAQPVVIFGWYLSSILLICIVAIMGHTVGSANDPSVLYFVLSSFLLLTVWGAYRKHYEKVFHLTTSQRTLMVQTISFLVYLMLGSVIYAHLEGWRYLDALYWSEFTLLTIGLGYPAPKTHTGRGLLFPYAFGGIIILGIVIGSIRTLVIERGETKMNNRLVEKTRRKLAKGMTKEHRNPIAAAYLPRIDDPELDEQERRRREFHAMRKVRQIAHNEQRWVSLLLSLSAVLGLWLIGAVIFWKAEGLQEWSYFVALYFSYTSLLTIGYGDVYPISTWGKAFFVVWSLLAVPAMTIFISNMGDTLIRQFKDFTNAISDIIIPPSEQGFTDRATEFIHQTLSFYPQNTNKSSSVTVKSGGRNTRNGEGANADIESRHRDEVILQHTGKALEEEQLQEEGESHERGDVQGENIHHYTYLLIRELRKMFLYLDASSPKEFDYEEWTYYLRLLGEDEADVARHHRPPPTDKPEDSERGRLVNEIQMADRDERKCSIGDGRPTDGPQNRDRPDTARKWSWMGHRSPLLGDKQEAQWLLEALADKLETELRKRSEAFNKKKTQAGARSKSKSKSREAAERS